MKLANRVNRLEASSTLAVASTAARLKASGVDIIRFAAGEPDLDTPPRIREVAKKAIDSGESHYRPAPGTPAARQVVARKLATENHLEAVTADHVVISAGGKHALYLVLHCLFDAGSDLELLLPVPSWVSYRPIAELAGAKVVELPTGPGSDFKITPSQLEEALTSRSRALVLNSPSNPTGSLYSADELRALAHIVTRHNSGGGSLLTVSDDIYEKLIYGDTPFATIGQFLDPDVAITINGLSKAYAMTGWRIGYTAAPLELAKAMTRLQGQMITCIPAFCYPAMVEALTNCSSEVAQMRDEFQVRRDLMYDLMSKIPGLECSRPAGAFYLFPSVSAFFGMRTSGGAVIDSGDEFATALLEEAHVAVVPGTGFGGCGVNHVRFSYACSRDEITRGMECVKGFVESLT